MYIIHEQQLVHVDRGSDILEHYGVKGMKWGKRAVDYAGSFRKMSANQFAHPILSRKAYSSSTSKSSVGSMIATKRSLDYQNKFVKTQLDAKAETKKKIKELKKNKYKKADALNHPTDKKLAKVYDEQVVARANLSKNSKVDNYLTKAGRRKRAEAKKEVRKINNTASSLEDKMISNYKMARKEYRVTKKNLKDERKNATTGLRY